MRVEPGTRDYLKNISKQKVNPTDTGLSVLLNLLSAVIFRCRLDSRWTLEQVNGDCLEVTGYGYEELSGDRCVGGLMQLVVAEDREKIRASVFKSMEKGEAFDLTFRIGRKDGEKRRIWMSGAPVESGNAGSGLMDGILIDISSTTLAEKLKNQSEERFQDLIDSLPQVVFETDREGRLTFGNEGGLKMFGRTREEMDKGLYVLTMIAPEDVDRARQNIGNVLAGRSFEGHEYMALKKDGSRFPITIYSTGIYDENQSPLGMRGIIVDASEQKYLQKRQRLTLDVLETLNSNLDSQEMISRIIQLIRRFTGVEAIGIRLRQGDDYPFYEEEGFPEGFLKEENSLIAGARDNVENSDDRHECVCGAVVDGRSDPSLPCFTQGGSFWVQSSAMLIELKPCLRQREYLRGHCLDYGFESLALIPVRSEYEMIGMIQMADHRPGIFNPELIAFFEGLGSSIGIAISRKLTSDRLRESETRFREMVENINEVIYSIGHDGVLTYISPAVKAIAGYEPAEIIGRPFTDFIHPDDIVPLTKKIQEIYEGSAAPGEWRVLTSDGETRWIHGSSRPILRDGRPVGLRGIITDITARKQFEEELSVKNCAIDSALTGIVLASLDGTVTYANEAFLRMWGYESADQVLGHSYSELLLGSLDDDAVEREFFQNGTWRCELNGKRCDGSKITVLVQSSLVRDEKGRPVRFVGSCTDTTEIRQLEQERGKAAKLESVGLLAGGIAHDFNNILTGVLGNISLARALLDRNHRAAMILSEAEKAALIAKNLTQQLLTFSKGGMPVKTVVSLESLIRDAVSFSLHGSNVNCNFDIYEGLWMAEVDEGQVSQVINNLVINADQAMPDGGSLKVRALNRTLGGPQGGSLNAGDYVCITIEDEGAGIPKEHLTRIFDPYFTTKQKGSGLGLATSYAIIKKHGGDILVESELGQGSRFHVFLPAVREAEAQEPIADKDEITPGCGRVLLMDDEPVVRDVACAMLEEMGYSVTPACDGREAVEIFCSAMQTGKKFDLVILDLTVPGGVGGKETMRRLLEIDSSVKAVVSSGYSVDPVLSRYRENGFKGIISKPYRMKDLSDCLKNLLSAQSDNA